MVLIETAVFDNSGSFDVMANAVAGGASGEAFAGAIGYAVNDDFALDVTNSGTMNATAIASAASAVSAEATAIQAIGAVVSGTVVNSGTISAVASAVGGAAFSVTTAGPPVATYMLGTDEAQAVGIHLNGGQNLATVTNSGTISVLAVNDGATVTATAATTAASPYIPVAATGILFAGGGATPATGTATINNSGTIIAMTDLENDGVFELGNAINVQDAPNAVAINLLGGGDIYGNIEMSADDAITVSDGETSFEGWVNPDQVLEGSLAIAADGTLFLRDNPDSASTYNGASKVYVDDFDIVAGGTLALELPSYDDSARSCA